LSKAAILSSRARVKAHVAVLLILSLHYNYVYVDEMYVCLMLDRIGLVESKIRLLIGTILEKNPLIKLAHVNPRAFAPLKEM